jgi:hypothetical protein
MKISAMLIAIRRSHDLSRGRQLVTLKDAANYIMKLPKAEQKSKGRAADPDQLTISISRDTAASTS